MQTFNRSNVLIFKLITIIFFCPLIFVLSASFCMADGKKDFQDAENLWQQNIMGPSVKLYQKAIKSGELTKEQLVTAHYNMAINYFFSDPRGVIIEIDSIIKLQPTNGDAFALRADAWSMLQEDERALADWKKALDLNPTDSISYNNRSIFYEKRGDFELAIMDLEKYIQLEPDEEERKADLARLKDKMQQKEQKMIQVKS